MDYLLAVDVGGTKCDALLADGSGLPLAWARSKARPGDPIFKEGFGRSPVAIRRALDYALAPFEGGELVYASLGDKPYIPEGLLATVHPLIEIDSPLALAGVSCGIVALAGTGALVHGISENGRRLQLDGLGPYYGDFGSAFQIGLMGLRASARSSWHPRFSTILEQTIPNACREMAGDPNLDMVLYMLQHRNRGEVASLAKLVGEAAEQGDGISQGIIKGAARQISETVFAIASNLGLLDQKTNLVGTGSVMRCSKLYWQSLSEATSEFMPGVNPILPMEDAVFGMALAAAKDRVDNFAEFRSKLLDAGIQPHAA